MGMSEFEERWLRLAILIYKTSTAAAKDVLDKAISRKYSGATFELKLETALSKERTKLSNKSKQHLLKYEIETVFPPPPAALPNVYSKFDINIVAKLIKYFVGETNWKKGTDMLPDISNLRSYDWLKASPFALVELMRLYRNWVYHHTGDPPINEVEYNERFDDLVNILKHLKYDTGDVLDLRYGPLRSAKEDIAKTVKDAIEAAQVSSKADFAGLKTDVANSWHEIKSRMNKLEGVLNALKDGMLTEESLNELRKKFEQYQAEVYKELFQKIEEILGKLGDLSSIVTELKNDVAKKNDMKVLEGGLSELLQTSADAKFVLERIESCVLIMPDLVQAVQKLIKTIEMKETQIVERVSDSEEKDKRSRARAACRTKNESLINVREKDVYGDDIEGKSKSKMMVTLVTTNCRDIDDIRLNSDERKAYLNRDFARIKKVDTENIFKEDHVAVIRGLPGAGKSTFCHYLLREWNAGRLWDDKYEFVFYINSPMLRFSLRQEPFTLQSALTVSYPNVFDEAFSYKDLSRYLVIVDAIDECDVNKICGDGNSSYEVAISNAITNEAEYDRMIVGRPLACHDVREKLLGSVKAQFVEVLGFATEQVEEYVQMFFRPDKEKADAVFRKIRDNHGIFGMAHLPVFANIICEVVSENDGLSVAIETVTELYVWACAIYFQKHLKKHHPDVQVRTLTGAFKEEALIDGLIIDSKMAFESIATGRIIFQSDDYLRSKTIYSTPFIVRREQYLCFAHQTHLEFLSAVHLFLNPSKLNEVFAQDRFRDVLPFLFGLLGGAVKDSDSPNIVKYFVAPLNERMRLDSKDQALHEETSKHPLCGKFGKDVFEQDVGLFLGLCFEFRNSRLLNDSDLFWNRDVSIKVRYHHQLEHVLYFMASFCGGKGNVRDLQIIPKDRTLSSRECAKLLECISHGFNLSRLELIGCKLDGEKMSVLAPALCLIPTVRLGWITETDLSSAESWKIFVRCVNEARAKGELRLERLELIGCELEQEAMSVLAPALCLIPTVQIGWIYLSSAESWKSFFRYVSEARAKGEVRIERLELIDCELDQEAMSVLAPALCLIPTVQFRGIYLSSAAGCKSFVRYVSEARAKGELRLERMELIDCELDEEEQMLGYDAVGLVDELLLAVKHVIVIG